MLKKRSIERLVVVLAALAGLAVGAGAYLFTGRSPDEPQVYEPLQSPGSVVAERGAHRPDFTLMDLNSTPQNVSQWDGKLLVINFWATWCAPCRHEVPFFIDQQNRHQAAGLQIVGVAIDEPGAVRAFVEELGVNYPSLHGQLDALAVSKAYGNTVGALPYTVFVGRDKRIVLTKNGAFERDELEAAVEKLL